MLHFTLAWSMENLRNIRNPKGKRSATYYVRSYAHAYARINR